MTEGVSGRVVKLARLRPKTPPFKIRDGAESASVTDQLKPSLRLAAAAALISGNQPRSPPTTPARSITRTPSSILYSPLFHWGLPHSFRCGASSHIDAAGGSWCVRRRRRRRDEEEEERCHSSSISACVTGAAVNRCPRCSTFGRPPDGLQPPGQLHSPQSCRGPAAQARR